MAEESVEQVEQEQSEEDINPFALFSEAVRLPVEGLTHIGHLTDHFEFCGHTFGVKTLLTQDKMAIGLVLEPYRNTIFEPDVYQALHVGLALTEIDRDQNFCPPIGPELTDLAKARLNYLSKRWYPPTIEYVWNRYILLEARAAQATAELDSLSRRVEPTNSSPWPDSLKDQGDSEEQTDSDTPLFPLSSIDS